MVSLPTTRPPAAPGLPPPLPPALADTLVVYRVATAAFTGLDDYLDALLTPAERQRATRYAYPADRLRFRVGRAGLRYLLGQRLGLLPAAVALGLGRFGKPQLAPPAGLHFNVAHSGEWVLIALASHPVGVDVEWQAPMLDFAGVAAYRFSAAEQLLLAQSPQPQATFYQLWTQLEARTKAAGLGLSAEADAAPAAAPWSIRSFGVAPGYSAALAYPADWQPVIQFRGLDARLLCQPIGRPLASS